MPVKAVASGDRQLPTRITPLKWMVLPITVGSYAPNALVVEDLTEMTTVLVEEERSLLMELLDLSSSFSSWSQRSNSGDNPIGPMMMMRCIKQHQPLLLHQAAAANDFLFSYKRPLMRGHGGQCCAKTVPDHRSSGSNISQKNRVYREANLRDYSRKQQATVTRQQQPQQQLRSESRQAKAAEAKTPHRLLLQLLVVDQDQL